jgi:hypothetical protein
MDAEPSVRALVRQQRPHHGTVEDLVGVDDLLAEQIPAGQQADSGFRRGEQPVDGVHLDYPFSQQHSSMPSRQRASARAKGHWSRPHRRGEATVDRVIAFSDGVVAIALTLLILPLTKIERGEGATLRNVAVDNSGALFAFALSFALIANYWTIHKDIFRPLRRHNPRLVLLNML